MAILLNTRKWMRYQLYRIRCQNRYGNFIRQFDIALYISDLTIFNINRIHSSQTYITEVVLQYSDVVS